MVSVFKHTYLSAKTWLSSNELFKKMTKKLGIFDSSMLRDTKQEILFYIFFFNI